MTRTDRWLLLALLASLGLPWAYVARGAQGGVTIPGYLVPGFCRTVYEPGGWASMECTMGFVAPDLHVPGVGGLQHAVSGHAHAGRFGVVAAAALLVLAARRRSARLQAGAGALLLASNVLTAGLGLHTAGASLAWLVGMALLARGLAALPPPAR
jgi:hypothetical protein